MESGGHVVGLGAEAVQIERADPEARALGPGREGPLIDVERNQGDPAEAVRAADDEGSAEGCAQDFAASRFDLIELGHLHGGLAGLGDWFGGAADERFDRAQVADAFLAVGERRQDWSEGTIADLLPVLPDGNHEVSATAHPFDQGAAPEIIECGHHGAVVGVDDHGACGVVTLPAAGNETAGAIDPSDLDAMPGVIRVGRETGQFGDQVDAERAAEGQDHRFVGERGIELGERRPLDAKRPPLAIGVEDPDLELGSGGSGPGVNGDCAALFGPEVDDLANGGRRAVVNRAR